MISVLEDVGNFEKESCFVVIPTYRERENILPLLQILRRQKSITEVLIIDDGSDDGTQDILRKLQADGYPITVLQRHRKLGLGTAYVLALSCGRWGNYQYVIQMDADMSHDPADIPRLLAGCRENDIAVGSRCVPSGGSQGWPWYRKMISWMANCLVRSVLRLKIKGSTAGFRCVRRTFLMRLPLQVITSSGFAFQWEFNRLAQRLSARFIEIPVCFLQRTKGASKMSLSIMLEGLFRIVQICWEPLPEGQADENKINKSSKSMVNQGFNEREEEHERS